MSIESTFSIKRGGTATEHTTYVPRVFGGTIVIKTTTPTYVATGIGFQLDNISEFVIASSAGAIPNNSYTAISLGGVIPDIRSGDLLVDEGTETWNVDSTTTSGKAEYRVSGTCEIFPYDHMEVRVTRYVGKTP